MVVAANDGELVARLHFEAEHTNVLVVSVELLNGCLASTEIETMTAKVVNPHIPEFPVSKKTPHTTHKCTVELCSTCRARMKWTPLPPSSTTVMTRNAKRRILCISGSQTFRS